MAQYTTLSRHTLNTILNCYELGSISQVTPLSGGQANSSSIVATDSGTYVVSICDEKTVDEIGLLTTALHHLKQHNIATTRLIETKDGKKFITHQHKPVFIKEFIEGTVPDKLSESMASQLGASLAKLHTIPVLTSLPQRFSYGVESFPEIYNREDSFAGWLAQKAETIQGSLSESLPKGLIHGDLFADNTVFQEERLAAILDFEEVCHYFLIFDLGMCAAGCCCPEGTLSFELTSALCKGYQSIRQLSEAEKAVFQKHIEYAAVATAFWRFRQYNIRLPGTGMEHAYEEMKDLADAIAFIPDDVFLQQIFFR